MRAEVEYGVLDASGRGNYNIEGVAGTLPRIDPTEFWVESLVFGDKKGHRNI